MFKLSRKGSDLYVRTGATENFLMFFPLTRETCTREAKQSDSCHMTPSVALPSTFDGRAHGRRWFVNEPYLGTPVPARGTACGLPPPSSTIFRDACRSPLAPGVKVTSIVQLPPAANLDRHVVVSAQSPKFAPLMPTPEICKSSLLIFVIVAVRGSPVVPTT